MQGPERTPQRRVLRYFHRRAQLDEHDASDLLTWQGSGGFSVSHPRGRRARALAPGAPDQRIDPMAALRAE